MSEREREREKEKEISTIVFEKERETHWNCVLERERESERLNTMVKRGWFYLFTYLPTCRCYDDVCSNVS